MSRPILEQMTLWGQHYDQQVQSLRRAQDRAAAKDELVPLHVIEDHQTDMESLADQAANIMSTIHVALDRFIHNATATTMDPRYIIDGLLDDLGRATSDERMRGAAAHS